MATATEKCGVCELRHITKPPIVWCTECDEGLCTECQEHHSLSKGTRNHKVIPITEYTTLPAAVLMISQNCTKHDKKYQMYCQKHECPCCSKCIIESHKECQDFVELDDVIHNVKTSNAMCELEEVLVEVAENLQKIRQHEQKHMTTLKDSRKEIEIEIKKTRIKINNHLDKLQEDLIKQLNTIEEKENSKICQLLSTLEKKENEVTECQKNIINIKQHATDLQMFLSMKSMKEDLCSKDKFMQSLLEGDDLKQCYLSYNVDTSIQNIMSVIKSLGEVEIETKSRDIVLIRKKNKQAQIMAPTVQTKSIENIKLTILKTIDTRGLYIHGCCVLMDGRMVFTYYFDQKITVFNKNGLKGFDVNMPVKTFDIMFTNEDNTLAFSSGGDSDEQCITIIDMDRKKIIKQIPLNSAKDGIALKDRQLIYSGNNKGIGMINLDDESTRDIVRDAMPSESYVATFRDNIYHTNRLAHTVTCYNLQGEKQWTFHNKNVLKTPYGIDVDNDGNVYVVGRHSNNVVVISPDGKQHRELVTKGDGLRDPVSLHYNVQNKLLLVANFHNTALLFNLD